jgi:hypothetical protein
MSWLLAASNPRRALALTDESEVRKAVFTSKITVFPEAISVYRTSALIVSPSGATLSASVTAASVRPNWASGPSGAVPGCEIGADNTFMLKKYNSI